MSNYTEKRDPPSNSPQRQEIKNIQHFYLKLALNDGVLILLLDRELDHLLQG
jgi:hypothetical protein